MPSPSSGLTTLPAYDEPATAEEAVMVMLMRLGRRLRQRLPGEVIEYAAIPLLRELLLGPQRLSTLAAGLELDASTVSRQVRHLEDRGLVGRTSDPDDGRASRIVLSEEGRARLEEGARRRREMVAELLESWTESDREHLRILLGRLAADLNPHPASPSSCTHQENP